MSIYMNRLFARSNSSMLLSGGTAVQSQVSRLRENMFLVDSGLGTARVCLQDDIVRVPSTGNKFERKVGFQERSAVRQTPIRRMILERMFVDLVAGDALTKERATGRFYDMVGSETDVVPGEPLILLPKRFRQHLVWLELNRIWRTNSKVNGFVVRKMRRGYGVAIAGYIAFLPYRPMIRKRLSNDRFNVESIGMRGSTPHIVVF